MEVLPKMGHATRFERVEQQTELIHQFLQFFHGKTYDEYCNKHSIGNFSSKIDEQFPSFKRKLNQQVNNLGYNGRYDEEVDSPGFQIEDDTGSDKEGETDRASVSMTACDSPDPSELVKVKVEIVEDEPTNANLNLREPPSEATTDDSGPRAPRVSVKPWWKLGAGMSAPSSFNAARNKDDIPGLSSPPMKLRRPLPPPPSLLQKVIPNGNCNVNVNLRPNFAPVVIGQPGSAIQSTSSGQLDNFSAIRNSGTGQLGNINFNLKPTTSTANGPLGTNMNILRSSAPGRGQLVLRRPAKVSNGIGTNDSEDSEMGMNGTGKYAQYYRKLDAELIQCLLCKKILKRRGKFIQHLRTHTGEKPFECPFCEAKFSRKDNMNVHITRHHSDVIGPANMPSCSYSNDQTVACEECGDCFGSEEEMNSHLQAVHGYTYVMMKDEADGEESS